MRKNIFLHFMNRDAREVFGIQELPPGHRDALLNRALNTAICLCEDHCVMPPGFSLECEVAFKLLKNNQPYLDHGYIHFAQRESSLGALIEKKRSEYGPARTSFESLFSDAAVDFLRNASPHFVRRHTRIGVTATENWEKGPDEAPAWDRLKETLSPATVESLRRAPRQLLDEETALIWPALAPLLNDEARHNADVTRHALQNNYFSLYVREFDLVVLRDIPHFIDEFNLPSPERAYSYSYFQAALQQLGVAELLDADAETIVSFRERSGFIRLCDALSRVFGIVESVATLRSAVASAAKRSRFEWWKSASLWHASPIWNSRRALEARHIVEMTDGMDEVAAVLEKEFDLLSRSITIPAGPESNAGAVKRSVFLNNRRRRDVRTVVLATANPREFGSVVEIIRGESERLQRNVELVSDAVLPRYRGALEGPHGIIETYVVRADETGGGEAVDLLRRIQNELKPDCIFFVGCAALLDEKTALEPNLVFVARRAIDSDKREETSALTEYDMEQHHGDLAILRNIDALNGGGFFDPLLVRTNRDFVSGSTFMRSRDSPLRQDIVKKFPPNAAVLEMEAFAVLKAIAKQREEGVETRVAVIKGISDLGDDKAQVNKTQSQALATRNALTVVVTLLRHFRA